MTCSPNNTKEWLEAKARTLRTGTAPHVSLYVRSLAPPLGAHQRQDDILDQLYSFEKREIIESVSTRVWGKSICPENTSAETGIGQRIMDQLAAFRSWQSESAAEIELPFEDKHVVSSIAEEDYQAIVLPRVCLSVYSENDVELVLPCEIDGTTCCVEDFLSLFDERPSTERVIETSA